MNRYRFVIKTVTFVLNPCFRLCLVSGVTSPVPHHRKTNLGRSQMASVALARISGSVLATTSRSGTIRNGERAGQPWKIENANVLVADQNVTVVQLPRRDETGIFDGLDTRSIEKGELVDFLVEISIYNGDLQARVLGTFPAESGYLAA